MARLDILITAHPIRAKPYNQLEFVKLDYNRVPLYRVKGCGPAAWKALTALGRAFAQHGGKCFYCPASFQPQALSERKAHRDHVIATSSGGSNMLHNLVIACQACGREKANDPIHYFRPKAAKEYLAALERHIRRCVEDGDPGPA